MSDHGLELGNVLHALATPLDGKIVVEIVDRCENGCAVRMAYIPIRRVAGQLGEKPNRIIIEWADIEASKWDVKF